MREQTVKSILVIIPKLSDRIINGELLRYLAKTANDEQPGIRTNTTICLGKIARNLSPAVCIEVYNKRRIVTDGHQARVKVLTAAFGRSLRDPFVHARNAGLMALAATADLFPEEDCATKLLPSICPSIIDKEKCVHCNERDVASADFLIGSFEIKPTRRLTSTCSEYGSIARLYPTAYFLPRKPQRKHQE